MQNSLVQIKRIVTAAAFMAVMAVPTVATGISIGARGPAACDGSVRQIVALCDGSVLPIPRM